MLGREPVVPQCRQSVPITTSVNDKIREAVRVELARRDWNKTRLAEKTQLSRQYISELMNGKAGNLTEAWQRILDALGLELTVKPKGE